MAAVSPGVETREVDLSLYAEIASAHIFGVVGLFTKGPLNTSTVVTNPQDLIDKFGKPKTTFPAWYAARQYLRAGNQLRVCRVESTATPATVGKGAIRGGRLKQLEAQADGDAQTLAGDDFMSSALATFVTKGVQVGDYLQVTTAGANIGYYRIIAVVDETNIQLHKAFPGNAADLSYQIIAGKRMTKADGATSVPATRTLTSATGEFVLMGVKAGDLLLIEDADTPADNQLYTISSVTNATTLVVDRNFTTGSLASLTYSIFSPLETGADGVTAGTAVFTSAGSKFVLDGVLAGDLLVINDTVDVGDNATYRVKTVDSNTQLTLESATLVAGPGLTGLSFDVWPAGVTIQAVEKGSHASTIRARALASATSRSYYDLEIQVDGATVAKYYSVDRTAYGTVNDNPYIDLATPVGTMTNPAYGEWFTLVAGGDGESGIVDADYIGTSGKGLQVFRHPDAVPLSTLAVPGISTEAVTNELIAIAEERRDIVVLIDPPAIGTVATPQAALDYTNGLVVRTTAINSSFVSVCWPWVKVYDEYNRADVSCPPSGPSAGALSRTDQESAEWFAPAGTKRGKVRGATGLEYNVTKPEADILQAAGQIINPILTLGTSGVMIYGQKTGQRANTALNRLNVRRMLSYVQKKVGAATRELVFEPNDDATRRQFVDIATPLLEQVQARRGMQEFRVVCDTTNNPPLVIDNNQLRASIYIRPTKAAEIITISTVLTSSGANFDELVQLA